MKVEQISQQRHGTIQVGIIHRLSKHFVISFLLCTGWAKLNGANAVSFVVARFREFREFLAGEITVHLDLRTLRSIKIKYFSPEGATKVTDFLWSSILAVLLNHNFYIKPLLLTNNFYGKKSSALLLFSFISIYNAL